MDKRYISVAIDGPSASGKSTVAKLLASKLHFLYIDTGAMYRAYTLAVINKGLNPKSESESNILIGKINISFDDNNHILLDGKDVSKEIRENVVADNVSYIASYKEIRLFLVSLQQEIAKGKNVVMDGRDIGTYVLKDAQVKIFLCAKEEERARRRYLENIENGRETSFEDCLANIKKRDYIDSHREFCPLKQAEDAIILDSTDMKIEEVVEKMMEIIKEKGIELWVYH